LRMVQRQKIGVCRFRPETHAIALSHRMAIRRLVHTQSPNCTHYATQIVWQRRFKRKLQEDARVGVGS